MDAWLDLRVLLARGKPNGKLKENQAEMTCRLLSKRWRWSKDKVHRFLKLLEKANMMRFESRSQSRDGMSVITILKPFKSETVSATVRETVNLLDQKSLLDTSETVRETVCATSLEKDREVISKPVGGNAKREAAKRIREYCLEHGHWRPFQSGKTKEKATKNIMGWLGRSGYTEEQLIGYVDTYIRRRKAQLDYIEEYGEKPFYEDLRWCPHTKWPISELFRKSAKYLDQWIEEAEKPVTREDRVKAADRAVKDLYKTGDPGGIW